jgi:hypothetical protein
MWQINYVLPVELHAPLFPARGQIDKRKATVGPREDRSPSVGAEAFASKDCPSVGPGGALARSFRDIPRDGRARLVDPRVADHEPPSVGAEGEIDPTGAPAWPRQAAYHLAVGNPPDGDGAIAIPVGELLELGVERTVPSIGKILG